MAMLSAKRPTQRERDDKELALREISKEKKVRLSVDVDESVYKLLKLRSVNDGRKTVEIIREAISNYLDK